MLEEQTRIPTLAALFLIAFLSVGGLFAYDRFSSFFGSASIPVSPPENVQVTNITESSAVVVWQTTEPIAATIRYGNEQSQTAYDIRDTDSVAKPYHMHYFVLTGLASASSTPYEMVIGNTTFPQNSFTTARSIASPPQALPIYGEIQTMNGAASQGTIILTQLTNGATWSSFIFDTTSWVVPLAPIRTTDLAAYYCEVNSCTATTPITLTMLSEEGTTTLTTTLADARPLVNPVIIGQNYETKIASDSAMQIDEVVASVSATPAQLVQGAQSTPTPTKKITPIPKQVNKKQEVSILNPKEDATLRFPKPLIRGLGIPGEEVTITLESQVKQIDTVQVQKDGTWLWTPTMPLDPGDHTVSITTVDQNGRSLSLSRNFSIFKSGEQVLSAASPSATLAPLPTSTIVPTQIPTISPTAVIVIPSATPTPDMPVSASFLPSIIFLAGGLMLVLLGLAVL